MYENYMICEDGFENVTEDEAVTGFRFRIRITYYRGVVLSLIEGFEVTVDGEAFPRAAITFTVRDATYTLDELEEDGVTRWEFGEKATINVRRPGGLAPGEHTIEAAQQLRLSYIPWPLRGEATRTLAVAA